MNSPQKLALARLAYKEINAVIGKWESLGIYQYLPFDCHWNRQITVDGELFLRFQLEEHHND